MQLVLVSRVEKPHHLNQKRQKINIELHFLFPSSVVSKTLDSYQTAVRISVATKKKKKIDRGRAFVKLGGSKLITFFYSQVL